MIADYLARHLEPAPDGILFPSVQSPGEHRNVVLFHHASRVEA
ncbi:RES domain-containing protein, partial [Clostridium perfringens]